MSNGISSDRFNTCNGNTKPHDQRRNWLRHRLDTEAARIDDLILSGAFTIDEMAGILADEFSHKRKSHKRWIDRIIKEHIPHLENTVSGGATGQTPHGLEVVIGPHGRVYFGCP